MSNPDDAFPFPAAFNQPEDLMDAQLQQELRGLFDIDTQKGLQTYLDQVTSLKALTWSSSIQTLYRAVHTIKGGAVTVGADAILHVATSLEDLLSDLRHLETAPPLANGHLRDILTEAGELLASTLSVEVKGEMARALVEPSVQRIRELRSQIQQTYLPQWSEQAQIQQEFAQQGLDLVALDLTIALENLGDATVLPDTIPPLACSMVERLYHIGQELQLASGWGSLLAQAEALIVRPNAKLWCSQWPRLLEAFKACVRAGGEPVPFELSEGEEDASTSPAVDTDAADAPILTAWDAADPGDYPESEPLFTNVDAFLDGLSNLDQALVDVDWIATDPASPASNEEQPPGAPEIEEAVTPTSSSQVNDGEMFPGMDTWIIDLTDLELSSGDAAADSDASQLTTQSFDGVGQSIQVPVPLTRLDQSAQALITTLLSLRGTQGLYQGLHQQIIQLVSLAQEGAEHITRLRQIQDDYALLNNLKPSPRSMGPNPERYRQGYTTINRLLETSLRLSELGAEAEKVARQMSDSLQFLDGSVLKLQATVEESRLMPFRNLAFRARAILRDLSTRFQKPAQLVIQGERTELDIATARTLEPALLHLIRNAFDHALESPEERQALGKPDQGTLTLTLQRQGDSYRLMVQDDGRGLSPEAIRERALILKLPLTDTSTPAALLAVICQPGFSSETEVSDISGRGVGMDVVANQVACLGGRISLETFPGQGTTFYLHFPVPHLLEPCVVLQVGECTLAIPIDDVKTLALLDTLDATPVQGQNTLYSVHINTGDTTVPGFDLLSYWQPQASRRGLPDSTICVLVQSSTVDQGLWFLADDLIGQADLLISPLPTPLKAPEGLIGVSLQPDGTLVPVLNASALVDWLHRATPEAVAELSELSLVSPQNSTSINSTILIVDDAALMRRRLESSLNNYGHFTHTCADGLEAWNWLQANPTPALIITDIEMPNLDGFTLIDRCRQEGLTMPILVVSSRLLEDWFDEAQRLGANDYLTKGFSTLQLMAKVNQLLTQVSPVLSSAAKG